MTDVTPHGGEAERGQAGGASDARSDGAQASGRTSPSLAGRVAVVTGASSGIGLATARRLVAAGATVIGVDRDEPGLAAAHGELGVIPVVADVSRPDVWPTVLGAVERAAEVAPGGVAVVHLNAGIASGQPDLLAMDVDAYRRIMGVNVDHVVFGAQALLPLLEADGGGALVVTASLAGLVAFAADPVYTATKHAVVGLVRALAPHWAPRGVRINAVCPGMVDTPLIAGEVHDLLLEAGFPLIDADDVAAAVMAAAVGEDTGQAIVVQAGLEPTPYRFARPPGPREAGAVGRVPPGLFGDTGRPTTAAG